LTLLFTAPASLGFVLEILVVEEDLFARGKREIRPAVNALQSPVLESAVLKFWHRLAPAGPFPG
jgi:hypothetical protein